MLSEWDPESGVHIATIDAGDSLAQALGDGLAALIRSHGTVTVGDCVQQLVVVSNALVGQAEALYSILQIGAAPYYMSPDQAKKSKEVALGALGVERSWNYKIRYLKLTDPDIINLL
jgi:ribulose-5-phosphate 4-epimerase/fuculose-1-phosphate aldolase